MANIKKIKTAIRVLLLFIFQPTKTFGFLLGSCSFSLISSLTVCKLYAKFSGLLTDGRHWVALSAAAGKRMTYSIVLLRDAGI